MQPFVDKYDPQKFEDIFLPENTKKELKKLSEKVGYRALFFSTPGTGKTTTAKILTKLCGNVELMYLSGSNDFNIETFRNKVMQFASGFSVLQKQKFVIIDEAENIRDNLQDAFKIILDQCKEVNFIFITNEVGKMNSAIYSRCTKFDYNFTGNDLKEQKINYVKFIKNICSLENIEFDNDGLKTMLLKTFPDFRNTLIQLEQLKDSNLSLIPENLDKFNDVGKQMVDLYELIENQSLDSKTFYNELSKFKGKEKDSLIALGEPFFNYLNDKNLHKKTLDVAIILDKYCARFDGSLNKFVTFLSCINEIKTLFR